MYKSVLLIITLIVRNKKGCEIMKNAKRKFKTFIAVIMSFIVLSQTFCLPAYATTNPNIENTDPVTTESYNPNKDSTFVLANSDVQISDDYLSEDTYVSEIENPELTSITDSPDYELEIETRNYPEGLVLSETKGDPMVYLTQKWLNQEYGDVPGFGSVPENGKTGWDTIYGLTRALQHELGITDLANNFGPTTERLYGQNPLHRQDGVTNRQFAILQGALWCKGYSPGYYLHENPDGTVSFDEIFNESVERAVIELKEDAGLINPDGVVTVNVMKALMSMDAFKLLSSYGGDTKVRAMQQKLNRKYEAYTGLTPCDGVYGRNTNKAIVYALQAEEGLPLDVANGNFGVTTKKCCPQIPYGLNASTAKNYYGSYYTPSQISAMTELVQFALYVNGFGDGITDGVFDDGTRQAIREFQKKYAIPINGKVDKTTWLSLFISCGDIDRTALAADCATQLTAAQAKSLYDNGYRYIGRYLTGTYDGGKDKAIYRDEAERIFAAGLRFFPIYQTTARSASYFTPSQGEEDAYAAIEAAAKLGIPKNTIIYFAVDFDCMDYQITSNIIPYFNAVHDVMSTSIYKTGIYGTRNCCTRVSENGYACSSFVGDMSTGFSGNLGYSMPKNWAFDQFHTTAIGSGEGYLEIDKDGFSGLDTGVSKLDEATTNIDIADSITIASGKNDVLEGPTINILGYEIPLFALDIGLDAKVAEVEAKFDEKKNIVQVLAGVNISGMSSETTGGSKYQKAYTEVKNMFSAFGKNNREFINRYEDFKGSLYQRNTKVGFNMDSKIAAYMTFQADTGKLIEGGMIFVGSVNSSISYSYIPTLVLKFSITGSMQSGLNLKLEKSGTITPNGIIKFAVTPSISVGEDIIVANAYVGLSGTLDCQVNIPGNDSEKDIKITFTASLYFEYDALLWGDHLAWNFVNKQLYPKEDKKTKFNVNRNNLAFIEPLKMSSYSNSKDVLLSNIQTYCQPQIIDLGNDTMLMAYIMDSPSRSAENRTILMYSYYDGKWSPAKPVFDDGTCDFAPKITSDGNGGAYIVWQNATSNFNSDVTLDKMASEVELYCAHLHNDTIDCYPITEENYNYEMSHTIAVDGQNISVVWKQNSENDPFGINGTNSIYRRQYIDGVWQNIEKLSEDLMLVSNLETTYIDGVNIVAYSTKTKSDKNTLDDLEIFYVLSDKIEPIQITNNTVPDYSLSFLNNELFWISGNSVLSLTDFQQPIVRVENLDPSVSKIKAVGNNEEKAIVWTQSYGTNIKFFATFYNNSSDKYGTAMPITEGNDVIRNWDLCLQKNGLIQLAYSAAENLSEPVDGKPYGQLDLIQKAGNSFSDIAVDTLGTYSGEIVPNNKITLATNVYNNGSQQINQLDIAIIDSMGKTVEEWTVDKQINIGASAKVEVPFTLPDKISLSDYKIKILPHNQTDAFQTNNESQITIGYADLAIIEANEIGSTTERQLNITVKNLGFNTIESATLEILEDGLEGNALSTYEIAQLEPNKTVTFSFTIPSSALDSSISENSTLFYIKATTETEESNYANNTYEAYVYPNYTIKTYSETGGTVSGAGTYIYNSTATLTATPAPGYIFAGWYENGQLLDNISATYSFTVLSNRALEAKFIPNNLSITNIEIFGTLEPNNTLTFTATAKGGEQPYLWEFEIYKDNELCYSNNDKAIDFCDWIPNASGEYKLIVNVTDVTGFKATYTKQFTVT